MGALIRGIDVSDVQGSVIDWHWLAAQGVAFAYHRCGDGNDAPDPNFAKRTADARAAGLLVGAYAVGFPLPPDPSHPGREPEAQAKAHFEQCRELGTKGSGDLPPMLDLEWPVPGDANWVKFGLTTAFVRGWALAYLAAAASLWGRAPVLYDGFPDYWAGIEGPSEPAFANYPLWVVEYPAAYEHTPPPDDSRIVIPKPWEAWTFWQHCGGGMRLQNGVPVDGDVFNGDAVALRAFAVGDAVDPVPGPMT